VGGKGGIAITGLVASGCTWIQSGRIGSPTLAHGEDPRHVLRFGALLLAAGVAACAPDASAPAPTARPAQPAPVILGEIQEIRGRIETVDQSTREVLVRMPGDRLHTVVAGPEVQNLAQVRAGDHVVVRYHTAVAVRVAPAGSAAPDGVAVGGARAEPGSRPGAAAGAVAARRVRFVSYNRNTHVATVVGADGRVRYLELRAPEMQAFARSLRRGQMIDAAFAEAVAVGITPMAARR
jgi:hypothetical protein